MFCQCLLLSLPVLLVSLCAYQYVCYCQDAILCFVSVCSSLHLFYQCLCAPVSTSVIVEVPFCFISVCSVFAKSATLFDKTGMFSFCPARSFSLSDNCPVNLSKENNIPTINMSSVLQIRICPAKDYSLSYSCPVSVEKISRRLFATHFSCSVGASEHLLLVRLLL